MALRATLDFELLAARNTELAALHETTIALLDRMDVDSILATMLDSARGLVGTEHGYIYLVDPEQGRLRLAVGLGYFERVEPQALARGEGLSGRVWEQRRTLVIDDYRTWEGAAAGFEGHDLHASVGVPLLTGGEVVGVLGLVLLERERRFGPAEVALLERFSHLASLALENARLYGDLQNQLAERSILDEQLRQAQKMESIGRLAGGIAHDFNNLLTAIRGYAELTLLDVEAASPLRDNLDQIARAASRAADLTGQLLAYSRKQVLRPQVLDLNSVVGAMSPMLARMLGEDVVLTTTLDPELGLTRADPAQIEQVVLNLAVNARDAMPAGGKLLVRTTNMALDDGPHVALVVADYRRRHGRGDGDADLRALLHDQAGRRGYGARARDRARDRRPERWLGLGRLRARHRHHVHGLPAASDVARAARPRRAAARRAPRGSVSGTFSTPNQP